jgi:DNA-binding response OmpR family regulator
VNRILVVEDGPAIAQQLTTTLELDGFTVQHAADLAGARRLIASFDPELVVLDVNLPDGTGFELCEELRRNSNPVSILFLTARLDEESVVKGFASGGCDFLRKPYGVQELLARIRRLLARPIQRFHQVSFEEITLDVAGKKARLGAKPLELTNREFDLLALLVRARGEIVTRDQMLQLVDEQAELLDRSLDSHISRLRTKLKKSGATKVKILADYGRGYRLGVE